MTNLKEVTNITYYQILTYFGYTETYRTSYYIQYTHPQFSKEYVLFININKDGAISLFDVFNKKLIDKINLILELSPVLNYNSIYDEIQEINSKELKLNEEATEDEIIKKIYDFNILKKDNKFFESFFYKEFIHQGSFENIFQTSDEKIIVPLIHNKEIINYLLVDNTNSELKYDKKGGYYSTKITTQEDKILVSFDLNHLMKFFQQEMVVEYICLIPNPKVDFKTVYQITTDLDSKYKLHTMKPIDDLVLLYSSLNLSSCISMLQYFMYYTAIHSDFRIFGDISQDNEIIIKIYPPSNVDVDVFIPELSNINYEILTVLGIDAEDKENSLLIKEHSYNLFATKNDMQYISFIAKVELIIVLIKKLNELIYAGESKILFVDVDYSNDNDMDFHAIL